MQFPDPKAARVCGGGTLDYNSTAFQIKLKPHDTVHKIYKTCSPVTDLLWPYRIKQKKKIYMENTATFDPKSPQTGSWKQISQLWSHGVTKENEVQPAFPVIACHHFWMPLSELFSSMVKNTEISLGMDGRPGGGLKVKKKMWLLPHPPPPGYIAQVTRPVTWTPIF